jgi:hypothetical protein
VSWPNRFTVIGTAALASLAFATGSATFAVMASFSRLMTESFAVPNRLTNDPAAH